MATKNRSKSKPAKALNVLKNAGPLKLSQAEATYFARTLENAKEARLSAEAKARAGIRLTGKQADAATGALADANIGVVSCFHLARMALDSDEADWLLQAIMAQAQVCARKIDAVAQLLGDPGYGNFQHELSGTAEGLTAEA